MFIVKFEVILCFLCFNGQLASLTIMYTSWKQGYPSLNPNDDGSSAEIPIITTFPYFDKNYNSLFVNTNGLISFTRPVSQYTSQPFPLGDNRVMIAPFWADVDIRRRGKVWYREMTNADSNEFGQATEDVKTAFPVFKKGFKPTWLFIATWDKVPFYDDINKNHSITNTFQLVLITNGRHSFVIFIYEEIMWTAGRASGGDDTGLNGKQAECGFNAGDGSNYFSIVRSNMSELLKLPNKSNIDKPGVWVYKIDNAEIEAGGCNTKGFLTFPSGNKDKMHGGTNIDVTGPCYSPKHKVVCKFGSELPTSGRFVKQTNMDLRLWCTAPMVNHTRKTTLKVSLDGGKSFPFLGHFQYVGIGEKIPRKGDTKVYLKNGNWTEDNNISIMWNDYALGNKSEEVKIQIARYILQNNVAKFHSFFDFSKQRNTGNSQILIPEKEGKGRSDSTGNGRFVSFIRVIKEKLYQNPKFSAKEWIWSDVITWQQDGEDAKHCKNWYKMQPEPRVFTENSDLVACPPTKEKALKDIGRYETYQITDVLNSERTYCVRTIVPSNKSAGQECCFNEKGNLIMSPPYSGKLVRLHRKSGIPYISNYFHDVLPHQDCCRSSKNQGKIDRICKLFYEKRPSDNGKKYEPPRPAVMVGDPHMVTLDGVQYTFNGIGEYHILKILPGGFSLQGRMEQMPPVNKTQINATVYTSFAMAETGSDIIQIQLNGRGLVDVFVNAEIVNFAQEDNLYEFLNGFILKSLNTSSYSVVFRSGICVTIEGYQDLLQSLIIVPEIYKEKTSGLFGFWDDDEENEFLLPNGTFLNASSSSKTIHYDFGLQWATKENESLFFYRNGKNHSSYYKPDFVPEFFDYRNLTFEDQEQEKEARKICANNLQCLFDIKMTGKTNIALSSKKSLEEFREILEVTERKDCLPIGPNLENGVIKRNDSKEGILLYFFWCNSHYVLNGSEAIICKQGEWNGTKPRCVECKWEDSNIIGHIAKKTSHAIRYDFACKNGYKRVGPSSMECRIGQWTRDEPRCIKQCKWEDSNIIGHIAKKTNHAIRYDFACKNGYKRVGPSSMECRKGQWTRDEPRCIKHKQKIKEKMLTFHVGLISAGCAILVIILVLMARRLVRRRFIKRKEIRNNGRETSSHPEENVDFGEQNKVMTLSYSNLAYSFGTAKK